MLIREIAAGRIPDGSRLPTERQMASDLGIAIGTLRKALATLEDKGLLERIQGSGNYVRARANVDSVYSFFRLELTDGGGLPTADVLDVQHMALPPQAERLKSEYGHRIRRLRKLNDAPVALEEIWLDASHAKTLIAEDLAESLYYYYKDALGLIISQVEDRVGVADIPGWAPAQLAPRTGTPSGFIERISYDQNGDPAEYSRTWFDHTSARYTIRL